MTNRREAWKNWMAESVIVADGAMGTLLRARGLPATACVEEATLSRGDLVYDAHRDYLHAGAQILTTNTFRANRLHLTVQGHADKLRDINARGVEIARRAAHGAPVWVGASVGPLKVMLKPYGDVSEDEAREVCREQIAALADAGPDLFILETQQSVVEALFFLEACRALAPDVPVLASLTVSRDGRTFFGDRPVEGCRRLAAAGADVVGINCSVGPADTLPFVEEVARGVDHPLAVMPNGGYPAEIDGGIVYLSSPEYVAEYVRRYVDLGVNVVGGCCGTTPETIRAVSRLLKGRRPAGRQASEPGTLVVEASAATPPPSHAEAPGGFFRKLGASFAITCEIDPPKGPDAGPAVEAARLLKRAGADAVNIAENPMARVRVAPMALAHFIEQETGLSTILHMTCRDRNLLGLQSELLGAALLGVDGILALSGDPASLGDFPSATSVNDVNVVGLVKIVASLNRGLDFSDNATGASTHFGIGVGASLAPRDPEAELLKLRERAEAGATFALTQPVFDLDDAERFLDRVRKVPLAVLPGLLPLAGLKQALYLHNEVPGMRVPESILRRLESLPAREDQMAFGVDLARRLLEGVRRFAPGAYLTSGGRRASSLADVLSG